MACFIVPLVQAVATSIYCKTAKNSISNPHSALLKRELPALEKMLWGGSVMLIADHIINGELTWKFPFFTALGVEGGGAVMLREMLTVGLPISIAVTAVWAIYAVLKARSRTVKA
jgi:hypothetical protein